MVLGCSELFQVVPTCFSVGYVVLVLGCFGCSCCFGLLLVVLVCCSVLHLVSKKKLSVLGVFSWLCVVLGYFWMCWFVLGSFCIVSDVSVCFGL